MLFENTFFGKFDVNFVLLREKSLLTYFFFFFLSLNRTAIVSMKINQRSKLLREKQIHEDQNIASF